MRGDQASVRSDTFWGIKQTLQTLDISRPTVPVDSSVQLNFSGFSKLNSIVWYNATCTPRLDHSAPNFLLISTSLCGSVAVQASYYIQLP